MIRPNPQNRQQDENGEMRMGCEASFALVLAPFSSGSSAYRSFGSVELDTRRSGRAVQSIERFKIVFSAVLLSRRMPTFRDY